MKKVYIVTVIISIVVLFIIICLKVPDVYCFLFYGSSYSDVCRKEYEDEWGVVLPASKLLVHESINTGYDGGGTHYTVFQVKASDGLGSGLFDGWNEQKDEEFENQITRVIDEISKKKDKDIPAPDFNGEYYWKYYQKQVTGTGADGTKSGVFLYTPGQNMLYCIDDMNILKEYYPQ